MDKILLISELYPIPSKENVASKVCHYFTREWVKLGKQVVVVHFQPVHCFVWYIFVRLFGSLLESRLNGLYYKSAIRQVQHYFVDNVEIFRIPCWIPIPKGRFSPKSLEKFSSLTQKCLADKGFFPDMIVGHLLPIELIPILNRNYGARTCMVAHGPMPKLKMRYPDYRDLINSYTGWGFRSEPIRKQFEVNNGKVEKSFICYSGVPSTFYKSSFDRVAFDVSNILYVGDLIRRKNPLAILMAAYKAFEQNFTLTIVGDGEERAAIEKFARKYQIEKCVRIVGKVSRDKVKEYMDNASVFVMISTGEAFGLVYLEAMSRGCITIASENEGMDGIIVNGHNGYLLPAGDVEALSQSFKNLQEAPMGDLISIAERGYKTSLKFSDKGVAEDYLNKLENL